MSRRLLVTGSRSWTDSDTITAALKARYSADTVLVHGGCTGADALAHVAWLALARQAGDRPRIEVHPAQWRRDGRRAGYVRNAHTVTLGADECVAFILDNSPGATHTAKLTAQAGIPTTKFELTSIPAEQWL